MYRCGECDYILRDNVRSGEVVVENAKLDVDHSGIYFPEKVCKYLNWKWLYE